LAPVLGPNIASPSDRKIWFLVGLSFIGKMVGKPIGMVPLIINPIYTLYCGYLLGPNPLQKGSNKDAKTARGPPSQRFSRHVPYDWRTRLAIFLGMKSFGGKSDLI